MNEIPDYSTYSLEELQEAHDSLDKEKYPDRLEMIREEVAKWSSREPEIPDTSLRKKWWKKNYLFAILVLFVPLVLLGGLTVLGGKMALENSPLYIDAKRYVVEDEAVQKLIGEPVLAFNPAIAKEWKMGKEANVLNFSIKGPQGEGSVKVEAAQFGEMIKYNLFEVTVADTTIDFMAD